MSLDSFFDSLSIPIEQSSTIEYEIGEFCHLVYEIPTKEKYIKYIDIVSGEVIEDTLLPENKYSVNGIVIEKEDLEMFESLIKKYLDSITI